MTNTRRTKGIIYDFRMGINLFNYLFLLLFLVTFCAKKEYLQTLEYHIKTYSSRTFLKYSKLLLNKENTISSESFYSAFNIFCNKYNYIHRESIRNIYILIMLYIRIF
ncbi:hypothetical protein EDEG_03336 [Edhazardia aedis USNM 41457]|uniref:Uncharacterized protein n=1 Tax=Edhazardia aedis (strain USNM 41457) TaxID=1003232 RepID=J8ZR94_EDHAE|nr:hypothetical protein EDEG_03336 [Edhazardia aedis USNM 41457]|eukprot:EJW02218.1 hypothetical protein EDEG_03336 [Edhazardia aedis USNM 41457]